MKINEVNIFSSVPSAGTVGENFTLQCTVYLLQPNSSSETVTSHLKFEWQHNPNMVIPAYHTVVQVFNPTTDGNLYYTQLLSTVQLSPLQVSHAGTVSCQVGDNNTLAADLSIIVNGIHVADYFVYQ